MGLLSYFKRQSDTAAEAPAASAEPDAVAAARTRARRRLIGATVLLGIGVIGFPLLFETQPRPVAVNIPIEIPRKDGAAPLALPAPVAMAAASAAVVADADLPAGTPRPAEITERAGDQGRELPASAPRAAASQPRPAPLSAAPPLPNKPAPASAAAAVKTAPASSPAAPKPAVAPSKAAAPAVADTSRAQALLDGQAASAASARVVVQVGAYTDADKLSDARKKLEGLGFKTYTQVVEGGGAKRTRVRVGPFASRAEADKAAARIKAAGLPVAILTL